MGKEAVSALVLPVEAAASGEAQVIAGVPGRWEPGVAYPIEALAPTVREARARIRDENLPLEVRRVEEAAEIREFARVNHAPPEAPTAAEAEPEPDEPEEQPFEAAQPEQPEEGPR